MYRLQVLFTNQNQGLVLEDTCVDTVICLRKLQARARTHTHTRGYVHKVEWLSSDKENESEVTLCAKTRQGQDLTAYNRTDSAVQGGRRRSKREREGSGVIPQLEDILCPTLSNFNNPHTKH